MPAEIYAAIDQALRERIFPSRPGDQVANLLEPLPPLAPSPRPLPRSHSQNAGRCCASYETEPRVALARSHEWPADIGVDRSLLRAHEARAMLIPFGAERKRGGHALSAPDPAGCDDGNRERANGRRMRTRPGMSVFARVPRALEAVDAHDVHAAALRRERVPNGGAFVHIVTPRAFSFAAKSFGYCGCFDDRHATLEDRLEVLPRTAAA